MRRTALVVGLCSLVAAGPAGAGAESAAGLGASLHAVDTQPLVVRGTHFEQNERVRLMLGLADGQLWRATEAGAGGRFTMGFGLAVGVCGRFTVHAFGSKGSRAWLRPAGMQLDCVSPDRGGPTTHSTPTT